MVINSSSVRLVDCFSVHSLIASHFDDDFICVFFYIAGFIVGCLIFMSLRYRFLCWWYVASFGGFLLLAVDCSFVGGFFLKNVCVFIFHYAVVMVAFDMITYTVLAQSFLTSILRVGVWVIISLIFTRVLAHGFVERADRKRRHLGFGFERRDDQIGVSFLSSVFALLGCSFIYIYRRRLVCWRVREPLVLELSFYYLGWDWPLGQVSLA